MSNSDKEFEEWKALNEPKIHDPYLTFSNLWSFARDTWNHLYPYKERCEELIGVLNRKHEALAKEREKTKALEAKVKELEDISDGAKTMLGQSAKEIRKLQALLVEACGTGECESRCGIEVLECDWCLFRKKVEKLRGK